MPVEKPQLPRHPDRRCCVYTVQIKESAALSHSLSQPRCGVGIYIVPRHLWISYPIYVNRKAEILKILSGTQNDRGVLARMAQEYVEFVHSRHGRFLQD